MPYPEVTCIIPVKDRKDKAIEAIESVFSNKGVSLEVILVDDGSKDGVSEAVKKYFPEVRIIRGENLGPGRARNLGARFASGDCLMFLDSDDLWLKSHVSSLLSPLFKGYHASFGIAKNIDTKTRETFYIPGDEFDDKRSVFENLFFWCSIVPSAFSIKRDIFFKTGGFRDIGLGEDWLFFFELSLKYDLYFVKRIVTTRRVSDNGLCSKNFSRDSILYLLSEIKKLAKNSQKELNLEAIDCLIEFTRSMDGRCQRIQDWYLALREQGLI